MEIFLVLAIGYCVWFYFVASGEQRGAIGDWSRGKAVDTAKGGFWLIRWLNKRI